MKGENNKIAAFWSKIGLDEKAVEKMMDSMKDELLQKMSAIDGNVAREADLIKELIENEVMGRLCAIEERLVTSEESFISAIKVNLLALQNDCNARAEVIDRIMAELRGQLAGGRNLLESIQALCKQATYRIEKQYGSLMGMLETIHATQETIHATQETILNKIKKFSWARSCELQVAWNALREADFDHARKLFEKATYDTAFHAEAYFGFALADCKIQLIWDPVKNCEQPICYDFNIELSKNPYFNLAKKNATPEKRKEIEKFAEDIKKILEYYHRFQNEGLKYDCFICLKEKVNGEKTDDLEWLEKNGLYEKLNGEAEIPTFCAPYDCDEETKKDGTKFEAHILYALSTARFMIIICSNKDYLETPWVKNEYTRFCNFLKQRNQSPENQIIIIFQGEPVALPGNLRGTDIQDYQIEEGQHWTTQSVVQAVKNRVERGKGYIERYYKYCSKCGRQYPNLDENYTCMSPGCTGIKLVDSHAFLNKQLKDFKEKSQAREQALRNELEASKEREQTWHNQLKDLENSLNNSQENARESKAKLAQATSELKRLRRSSEENEDQKGTSKPVKRKFCGGCGAEILFRYKYCPHCGGKDFYATIEELVASCIEKDLSGMDIVKDGACSGFSALAEPIIPKGVVSIGDRAFKGCAGFSEIDIPEGILSIGDYAFEDCTGVRTIEIPKSVKAIGFGAFSGCKNVKKIVVAEENPYFIAQNGCLLTRDGRLLFGCKDSRIPAQVVSIEAGAFKGCMFSAIELPNGLKFIGTGAFEACVKLSEIDLPETVESIGDEAFRGCKALRSFRVPASVVELGRGVFKGCTGLHELSLQEGLSVIGDEALKGCRELLEISIPESINEIGEDVFWGCTALRKKYDLERLPVGSWRRGRYSWCFCTDWSLGIKYYSISFSLKFNLKTLENEKKCFLWVYSDPTKEACVQVMNKLIAERSEQIPEGAFRNCTNLRSIEIPDGVTSIGDFAFKGCRNLISIKIPDGVTSIGDSAFEDCEFLTRIDIPRSVTSIGGDAFKGCNRLEKIIVDEGNHAYSSQDGILYDEGKTAILWIPAAIKGEISIPESITSLKANAFVDRKSLTGIAIPRVNSIGEATFKGSGLQGIKIGSRVKLIGTKAFFQCDKLMNIEIPESVNSIGDYAFKGCSNLTSIKIPDGVTSIGLASFYLCSNLKSIMISKSVNSIGDYAFSACCALNDIVVDQENPNYKSEGKCLIGKKTGTLRLGCKNSVIPDDVNSIGKAAFDGCSGLPAITIPHRVISIGYAAFRNCRKLTNITYQGTIADWERIKKGKDWDYKTGSYTVTCTDGKVQKDGTVERLPWWKRGFRKTGNGTED